MARKYKKKQETLIIEVTKQDISKGVQGSETNCPIARAVLRSLPKNLRPTVDVSGDGITIDYSPKGIELFENANFVCDMNVADVKKYLSKMQEVLQDIPDNLVFDYDYNLGQNYSIPEEAEAFIGEFDDDKKSVEPFVFEATLD